MLTITTDRKWKPFRYAHEVPARVLSSQFDYQDRDDVTDGFFCYRGTWYHLDQFMRIARDGISAQRVKRADMGAMEAWDAYSADSAFSGVVLRISRDGERYMVGTYIS